MIRFENVSKIYPKQDRPALEGVDLEIVKGEFVFLVGLSGSGKSTFLRLILKEETPTTGSIVVAGKDLNTLSAHKIPELRRQVGTVFQDFRLLPNKTVAENVAFTLHVLGYSQKEINREVPDALELVGLEEKADRRPSELAGGEQQRVAIARAYVSRPAILMPFPAPFPLPHSKSPKPQPGPSRTLCRTPHLEARKTLHWNRRAYLKAQKSAKPQLAASLIHSTP